jgi:hypothetical protein
MHAIHFRSFTPYSCGDTIGKPQTDDPGQVTCRPCRTEYIRLTEMEPSEIFKASRDPQRHPRNEDGKFVPGGA